MAVGVTLFLVLKQLGQLGKARARSLLQQGAKVVDVRSGQEFASGHLPNALNIPLDELQSRIAQQVPNKEQALLLHCVSGVRSGMGTRLLKRMGYTKVFNLGSYGRAERIVRQLQEP